MRLVAEHLVLACPSLPFHLLSPPVVISLLPTLPSPRPPLPHPLLLHQPHFTSYTDSHPSLSSIARPSYFITSILLLFSSSSCSSRRQHPHRLSVRPNTPTSRTTIPKAVYISLRIDRLSSQPILVPIAFWLYQVRNPPLIRISNSRYSPVRGTTELESGKLLLSVPLFFRLYDTIPRTPTVYTRELSSKLRSSYIPPPPCDGYCRYLFLPAVASSRRSETAKVLMSRFVSRGALLNL
jgi:hypothetical protein